MKVLLRNEASGMYYGCAGRWVVWPELAEEFGTVREAAETALRQPSQSSLWVVLWYEGIKREVMTRPRYCVPGG